MKIKIKRKNIVNEAAKSIADLPDGYKIYIANTAKYDRSMMPARYRIFISKSFSRNSLKIPYLNSYIDIKKHRGCGEYYYVHGAKAQDKFGPLLYDVAMEWATKQGSGLMADRNSVTVAAYNVWEYYLNKRKDVVKNTMEYDEGCINSSKKRYNGDNHKEWWESDDPLSKVYTKEANLLNTDKVVEKI